MKLILGLLLCAASIALIGLACTTSDWVIVVWNVGNLIACSFIVRDAICESR
jgi:hypothetical protein